MNGVGKTGMSPKGEWKEALSLTIDKNKYHMQKEQDYCMKMHAVIGNILLNLQKKKPSGNRNKHRCIPVSMLRRNTQHRAETPHNMGKYLTR